MQWTLPLSPWQQARRTVRARRRFSVGQVLKSARTNTLPAGQCIGGVTCVMIGPAQAGPAPSRASIAAGSHHRAGRDTLTRISSLSARTRGRTQPSLVSLQIEPRSDDAMPVPRPLRPGLQPRAGEKGNHGGRERPVSVTRPLYGLQARRSTPGCAVGRLSAPAQPPAPAGSGTPGTARWPACAPSCGT